MKTYRSTNQEKPDQPGILGPAILPEPEGSPAARWLIVLRTAGGRLARAALVVLASVQSASAANVLWVTDANDPATGFFPPNPSLTDYRFVTLLQNAGHNVLLYNPPASQNTLLTEAELTALNTNDVIILARCLLSGILQTPQVSQWNTAITKPIIDQSAFHARNSRLGWFTANEGPDDTPTVLTAALSGDPATDAVIDYLFGGVPMIGMNTVFPFDETADRNTSQIVATPVAGGIIYATATYVTEGNTAVPPNPPTTAVGNVIVGFPAGTAVRGGTDILAGYRMYFASGSREASTAPNTVQLYAGRENMTPTGEDIFLRAVQVAINNGAAPATDPNAPVAVTSQPASVTVAQGSAVSFSVGVTGAAPRMVQWQRDTGDGMTFTNVPDASTTFSASRFTLATVGLDDNNARFRVEVSNPVNTVLSDAATLTVTPDTAPPVPLSAASLDGLTVDLCFDEVVDDANGSVTDMFSYLFNGGLGPNVSLVTIQPDGRSVILTLDGSVDSTFTLNVSAVTDRFGNSIPQQGVTLNGTNLGLSAAIVGSLNPAGTTFVCDLNQIQISGGGLDLQSTSDQFQFAYKTVDGDFDARVRVNSIVGTPDHLETTAKAILTARESIDTASAGVNVFVTPPYPGDNSISSSVRTGAGVATNILSAAMTPGGPPIWMRITREGDVFTTYRSSDGANWIALGNVTVALAPSLAVGLGAASHRNGRLATATFGHFEIKPLLNPPTLTNPSFDGITFSASFETQAGVSYEVQYKNTLTAPMWQTLTTIPGDGAAKTFTDSNRGVATRFYQVLAQ